MAQNNLSPLQNNTDALIKNGMLDEKTAQLLNTPEQPIVPPATSENQFDTQQAVMDEEAAKQKKLQDSMAYSYGAAAKAPAATEATTTTEAPVTTNEKVVDAAEDVILQDAQQQQAEQIAQDEADIRQQAELNKQVLKSKVAEERAVNQVAAEEANKYEQEIKAIETDIAKERETAKKMSIGQLIGDMSTTNKILAYTGIFLSGLGAGMSGRGGNQALEIFGKQVDNALEQQNLSIKDKLAKKQGILDMVDNKLKQQEASTNDQLKKMQIRKMQSDMELARQQMYQQQVAARQQEIMIGKQQALQNKIQSGQQISPEEERAFVESLPKEDRKRYIPGFGLAKDAEISKNVSKALVSGEQVQSSVNKLRELMNTYGNAEVFDRGAVSQEKSARRGMQLQLKELFNLGVLNGPDLDLLNEYTGEDFFSPITTPAAKQAKLNEVEDYVKGAINANLRSAGLPTVGKSKQEAYVEKMKQNGVSEDKAKELYRRKYMGAK